MLKFPSLVCLGYLKSVTPTLFSALYYFQHILNALHLCMQKQDIIVLLLLASSLWLSGAVLPGKPADGAGVGDKKQHGTL